MHCEVDEAEKCRMVRDNFFDFLVSQVPDADLNAVDDIVIPYVFAAIEAVDTSPVEFLAHVNDLLEMMSAYVKDFYRIERNAVYIWFMDTVRFLREEKEKSFSRGNARCMADALNFQWESPAKDTSSGASSRNSRPDAQPTEVLAQNTDAIESLTSNSTSEDDTKYTETAVGQDYYESAIEASQKHKVALPASPEPEMYPEYIHFLKEMFPATSAIEIKHCVTIAKGEVEAALSLLIHRRENGQEHNKGTLLTRTSRAPKADPKEVKTRIIERYSYVDRESETKEHKPLAPKHAPKKMVRYRDNKIVSLKGERFTDVSKDDDDSVKKSNKKDRP